MMKEKVSMVDSKGRSLRFSLGALCLAGLLGWVLWPASSAPPPLGQTHASRAEANAVAGQGMTPELAVQIGAAMDYARLDPADFVLTAASFGGNANYAQAMLLGSCDIHRKTRHELDGEETRNVAMQMDPSGRYLQKLEFERKVEDAQCQGYAEQDYGKIADLMAAAAKQGDPHASAWVMDKRYAQIKTELNAEDADATQRASKLAEVQAMLPQARTLAEKGEHQAAALLSRVLASDTFGKQNVAESAYWLLVATQVPGTVFKVNPAIFQN